MRAHAARAFHLSIATLMTIVIAVAPVAAQDSPYFRRNMFGVGLPGSVGSETPTTPQPAPGSQMFVQINGPLSARVSEPFAMTATAINPPPGALSWTMAPDSAPLPVGLYLDGSSGTITGSRSVIGLTPVLKLQAANPAKSASSAPFRILFRAAGATGTASIPLGGGRIGESYYATGATADMDTPAVWALASGTLPPGLTLNPQGVVSGTPTRAGTYPGLSFVATGPTDTVVTPTYSITILPPLTNTFAMSAVSLTGNVGTYLRGGPNAYGGTKPYAYELTEGTLPLGISFNTTSGEFEGSPPVEGTTSGLVVRASDAAGTSASAAVTITIGARLPFTIEASSPSNGYVGSPMVVNVATYNAQGSVNYSLLAGSLPPGMDVSASDGFVRGTPTASGTFHGIVVKGVDTATRVATTSAISLVVAQPPPFYVTVPSGTVAFDVLKTFQTVTSQPGAYSYAWDVDTVAPTGVTLDPATGLISVRRTVGGTTGMLRLVATKTSGPNAGQSAKSNAFYFNIQNTGTFEVVMPDAIGPATVGEPYSIAFASRGAGGTGAVTGPLTWSTASTLPPGLRLDPETGRIEGVATEGQTSYGLVRVTATDAVGRTATSPSFHLRSALPLQIAWFADYPKATYKVRTTILLRGYETQTEREKARVQSWDYRSWETDAAKKQTVNSKAYIEGTAKTLPFASSSISSVIDYNIARTRISGQPGYATGKYNTTVAQAGDPSDVGVHTATLVMEDARGKPAKTAEASFRIIGPIKLVDYVSLPATDSNFKDGVFFGTCPYGATYVPAGTGGVEGLDEIRIVAVPNSTLRLDPVFENDPTDTALPTFEQFPWPGNQIPELPTASPGSPNHRALGQYGKGAGIPGSIAPGFYKNTVAIYDGSTDTYTYYNVKTLLNQPGSSCNAAGGVWNF